MGRGGGSWGVLGSRSGGVDLLPKLWLLRLFQVVHKNYALMFSFSAGQRFVDVWEPTFLATKQFDDVTRYLRVILLSFNVLI